MELESGEIDGDETSYHEKRDYLHLQHDMLAWLKALSSEISKYKETQFSICMPLGSGLLGDDYFAASPLGFRDWNWFKRISDSPNLNSIMDTGSDFFPWWNRDMDAQFWKRYGLVLLWCEIPWRKLDTENEVKTCRLALACFGRARELNPSIDIPNEVEELKRLTNLHDGEDEAPKPGGIGYKRRTSKCSLPGNWWISLPGYFHCEWHKDDGKMTYYFGSRTIHITTYQLKGLPKNDEANYTKGGYLERFEYTHEHLRGFAFLKFHTEQDSQKAYWMLQGKMAMAESLAFFTICFEDEGDKGWSDATWRTLFKPAPKKNGDA